MGFSRVFGAIEIDRVEHGAIDFGEELVGHCILGEGEEMLKREFPLEPIGGNRKGDRWGFFFRGLFPSQGGEVDADRPPIVIDQPPLEARADVFLKPADLKRIGRFEEEISRVETDDFQRAEPLIDRRSPEFFFQREDKLLPSFHKAFCKESTPGTALMPRREVFSATSTIVA